MSKRTRTIIVEVISAFFILLFVYAAISKVQDFEKFRVELGKSPVLNSLADFIVITIPAVELIIAGLLIIKRSQFIALYASLSLMVMFTAYIVAILKFSSYIPCSCGGVLQNMTWNQHLIFNLLFVLQGGIAILIYPKEEIKSIAIAGKAETL